MVREASATCLFTSQTLVYPRSRPACLASFLPSLSLAVCFLSGRHRRCGPSQHQRLHRLRVCELTTICNLFEEFSASVEYLGAFTDLASWCGWSSRLVASLTVRYRVLSVWGCSFLLSVVVYSLSFGLWLFFLLHPEQLCLYEKNKKTKPFCLSK